MSNIEHLSQRPMGRPSKGNRSQFAVRPPHELRAIYEERAQALGIPLSSWTILVVNEALGLPIPPFVEADLLAAQARRSASDSIAEELPIPKAS